MKPIDHKELYQNLNGFLKTKGIELKEGSYAQGIQKSCAVLAEAINLGQEGLQRAKTGIGKTVEQMRQVIHEKTAPKRAAASPSSRKATQKPPPARRSTGAKSNSRKARKTSR